ncbi:NfeD family protein, partial [Candidatus Hakubella thermalkaliphila]
MKRTRLFEEQQKLGAVFTDFAGWELPVYYSSILKEHFAVREGAGLFDVSHMGIVLMVGGIFLALGMGALVLGVVFLLIGIGLLFWQTVRLETQDRSKQALPELKELEDKIGETLPPLRPAGIAHLEGRKVDVLTEGEFLPPGTPVKVVKVLGNKIIVQELRANRRHLSFGGRSGEICRFG